MFKKGSNKIAENETIYLRKFTLGDAEFMLNLMNQPGWIEQIGDRNIHNHAAAKEYLKTGPMHTYKKYNFGLYLIVSKADDTPLGTCGLLQRSYLDAPDLGFAISDAFYRLGIGYQSALLVLQHAKLDFSISTLYATTKPSNQASQRLLCKLGFLHQGQREFTLGDEGSETVNLFKATL